MIWSSSSFCFYVKVLCNKIPMNSTKGISGRCRPIALNAKVIKCVCVCGFGDASGICAENYCTWRNAHDQTRRIMEEISVQPLNDDINFLLSCWKQFTELLKQP